MQWELVSILFRWMHSLYLSCLRFALTQWIILDPWKPAAHQSAGLTYPRIHACNNPSQSTRSTRLHIRACRSMLTRRLMDWNEYGFVQSLPIFWDSNALQIDRNPLGLNDWLQMLKKEEKKSGFIIISSTGLTSVLDGHQTWIHTTTYAYFNVLWARLIKIMGKRCVFTVLYRLGTFGIIQLRQTCCLNEK